MTNHYLPDLRTLHLNDEVMVAGHEMLVYRSYLYLVGTGQNSHPIDVICGLISHKTGVKLTISKLAELAYGYPPNGGDWPQSKDHDFRALSRLAWLLNAVHRNPPTNAQLQELEVIVRHMAMPDLPRDAQDQPVAQYVALGAWHQVVVCGMLGFVVNSPHFGATICGIDWSRVRRALEKKGNSLQALARVAGIRSIDDDRDPVSAPYNDLEALTGLVNLINRMAGDSRESTANHRSGTQDNPVPEYRLLKEGYEIPIMVDGVEIEGTVKNVNDQCGAFIASETYDEVVITKALERAAENGFPMDKRRLAEIAFGYRSPMLLGFPSARYNDLAAVSRLHWLVTAILANPSRTGEMLDRVREMVNAPQDNPIPEYRLLKEGEELKELPESDGSPCFPCVRDTDSFHAYISGTGSLIRLMKDAERLSGLSKVQLAEIAFGYPATNSAWFPSAKRGDLEAVSRLYWLFRAIVANPGRTPEMLDRVREMVNADQDHPIPEYRLLKEGEEVRITIGGVEYPGRLCSRNDYHGTYIAFSEYVDGFDRLVKDAERLSGLSKERLAEIAFGYRSSNLSGFPSAKFGDRAAVSRLHWLFQAIVAAPGRTREILATARVMVSADQHRKSETTDPRIQALDQWLEANPEAFGCQRSAVRDLLTTVLRVQ